MKPEISIVIPVFNEESRLSSLDKVISYVKNKNYNCEILIVDDGSTDNTYQLLRKKKKDYSNLKLIRYVQNMGKGYAIRQGMLKAGGKNILFMDMDLSTSLTVIDKCLHKMRKADVVIGSRRIKGSRISKHQPLLRELLGKGFTRLSQLVLGMNIHDFTCGFKCFSQQSAREVFKRSQIHRWGFDCEILFIAHTLGYRIDEIPVTWTNDEKTRVRFPHDIIRSFSELISIRLNDAVGKYQ